MRLLSVFLLVLFLAGCTHDKFPYPELLPTQDGKYSILYIREEGDGSLKEPDFLSEPDIQGILSNATLTSSSKTNIKEIYPKLNLETVPIVVIMDNNEVLLKTSDLHKAQQFLTSFAKK
ncbi:hypothetical protein ACX1C1_25995 [Paenibacillus sp. strain BS8-2]